MSNQTDATPYEPSTFWIAPNKNFRASARLHLQHLLFQNTLGFTLHNDILEAFNGKRQMKVADLGCGNAAWLCDLHDDLSKENIEAELKGYDVNPVQFPHSAFLPSTVELSRLDVLNDPLLEEMKGFFDVVHLRAFVSIINNEDTSPILNRIMSLLRPGGWLQWEETDATRFLVEKPSQQVSSTACETISHILHAGGAARGATFEFIGELDQRLSGNGFENVHLQTIPKRRQDFKGWTEDYLMVFEELTPLFPSKASDPQAQMTKEGWAELFGRAVEETERGVAVHQGHAIVVIGQKPV